MRPAGVVLLGVLGCAPAQVAPADTIQLSITARAITTPETARIELELHNSGNAAAANVTPIVAFRGTEILGAFEPALPPGATTTQTLAVPMDPKAPPRGTWPFYVRVSYSDSSQHPFEAIHVGRIAFEAEPPAPAVTLRLSGTRVETTGTLLARLDGPAGTPVTVTFAVPAGLAVVPEHAAVTLDRSERTLAAVIANAGANPASQLPVFAVAEYPDGDRHATIVATAIVTVTGAPSRRTGWLLGGLLLVLALAFAMMVRRPAFRRAPRR